MRNGSTGFYNDKNEYVCTGSMMGRRDEMHPGDDSIEPLRLQRVPSVGGDYDRGGAYWGSASNLWCAWGESEEEQVHCFVRASSREEAKREILSKYPQVKFIR